MASYQVKYHITVRDVDGISATVTLTNDAVADTGTIANLATTSNAMNTAYAPLTNGKVVQRSVTILIDEAQGVGTDAEFPLVSQKAILHYSNAQGSRSSISVPAPLEAIFLGPPSDDIINPANALVATWNTFAEAHMVDQGGNPLNLFQGGALTTRHRSRKRSIHA